MMNDASERGATEPGTRPATVWPVMVLAHNEERHIRACLDSIFGADTGAPFEVYVMANGCSAGTEDIVREYGTANGHVHLVSIALGDKCNAWNVFVHETVAQECPGQEIYFFMDGDVRAVPGSFSAMEKVLRGAPVARAVVAPPASGRSMRHDREELLRKRGLIGGQPLRPAWFISRQVPGCRGAHSSAARGRRWSARGAGEMGSRPDGTVERRTHRALRRLGFQLRVVPFCPPLGPRCLLAAYGPLWATGLRVRVAWSAAPGGRHRRPATRHPRDLP